MLADPVLRGPLYACAIMGALGAYMGVFVLFKRQSLVGETLSHACYPGMVVGSLLSELLFGAEGDGSKTMALAICMAFLSALGAAYFVRWLTTKHGVSADAALSYVLATSFALGLFLVSATQSRFPALWRRLQTLLMGQAATMRDQEVYVACALMAVVCLFIALFRRGLKTALFDTVFAQFAHLVGPCVDGLFLILLVCTVIVSIRSMGVVLTSSILIFPAVSARLLTSAFTSLCLCAMAIGSGCGVLGVLVSHGCSLLVQEESGRSLWLPTGPLIALFLALVFCLALLFAPRDGVIIRAIRRYRFTVRCHRENILKILWKEGARTKDLTIATAGLARRTDLRSKALRRHLRALYRLGLVTYEDHTVMLTPAGVLLGRKLVRLHRLWELYLVEYCHMSRDRVHPSAEEMEHILTPDIERELTQLLHNPSQDPHTQPIPPSDEDLLFCH